jgi:hypothetical protein
MVEQGRNICQNIAKTGQRKSNDSNDRCDAPKSSQNGGESEKEGLHRGTLGGQKGDFAANYMLSAMPSGGR